MIKAELHQLVDRLPDGAVDGAAVLLGEISAGRIVEWTPSVEPRLNRTGVGHPGRTWLAGAGRAERHLEQARVDPIEVDVGEVIEEAAERHGTDASICAR